MVFITRIITLIDTSVTMDVFKYLDTSVTRIDKLKNDNSWIKTCCLYI